MKNTKKSHWKSKPETERTTSCPRLHPCNFSTLWKNCKDDKKIRPVRDSPASGGVSGRLHPRSTPGRQDHAGPRTGGQVEACECLSGLGAAVGHGQAGRSR